MADYVGVGRKSEFYPGMIRACRVGGKDVAVVNVGGEFYAFTNACTHMGVPLSKGYIEDGCRMVCSLHHALFDLDSGKVLAGPAYEDIETFDVRLQGDEVQVCTTPRRRQGKGILRWIS
jgi:3-phenylpropionate/trans-cinnamate dioxygenase ferredoxin subunit